MQTITDYKGKHSRELPSDTSLPDELIYFYACFEASNTEACMRASAVLDDFVPTVTVPTYPNQKPWITGSIRTELKGRAGKHSREPPRDTSLPDELNYFYAHFEASNTEACMRASAVLDDCVITTPQPM